MGEYSHLSSELDNVSLMINKLSLKLVTLDYEYKVKPIYTCLKCSISSAKQMTIWRTSYMFQFDIVTVPY